MCFFLVNMYFPLVCSMSSGMYNDFKVIPEVNLNRILGVMGTAPVYPENGDFSAMQEYHDALVGEVRAIFKASYGFSDANVANW